MSDLTITITRTVAAPPDRVFRAWTDADQLAAWWWPQLAGTTYELDVRLGGRYRIHSPAAGLTAWGMYTEVDPPRRLAFTWNWQGQNESEDDTVQDHVIVSFEPTDAGTRVTVAHTSTEHDEQGNALQGWNDVMDRLARLA